MPPQTQHALARFKAAASDAKERARLLIEAARALPAFPAAARVAQNRVMGCTAQVWVTAELDGAGRVAFNGASDSEVTAGVVAVLREALTGLKPEEVLAVSSGSVGGAGLVAGDRVPAFLVPQLAICHRFVGPC